MSIGAQLLDAADHYVDRRQRSISKASALDFFPASAIPARPEIVIDETLRARPLRRLPGVHGPLTAERFKPRDGVLATVAGEMAVVAVDHRDARPRCGSLVRWLLLVCGYTDDPGRPGNVPDGRRDVGRSRSWQTHWR